MLWNRRTVPSGLAVSLGVVAATTAAALSRLDPLRSLVRSAENAVALAVFARDGMPELGAGTGLVVVSAGAGLGAACSWIMVAAPRRRTGWLGCVGVLVAYSACAHLLWTRSVSYLPVAVPLVGGLVGAAASGGVRKLTRRHAFARVRTRFGPIVSPAVLKQLADDPGGIALHGERREMTVLFAGIRGFDRLADSLGPIEIVALLQDWVTPMTDLVLDRGGTLDTCRGDRLMAFFGAPVPWADHVERACGAALAIRARLVELNAEWRRHGLRTIEVGIGLGTGLVTVGDMGADDRFDYTVVGPAVKAASRLERLTADYGVTIAVAEPVASGASARFAFREIDAVSLAPNAEPVRVFELAGRAVDAVNSRAFLERFDSALAAYRAGDLLRAERLFRQANWTRPTDGPSALYLRRIALARARGPQARGAETS